MSKEAKKRAYGGRNSKPEEDYTPSDVKEMKESKAEEADGFKKGGSPKKKEEHHKEHRAHGGKLEGHKSHMRMDKRARGGAMKHAAGGSPYSEGKKLSAQADGGKGALHAGEMPSEVD